MKVLITGICGFIGHNIASYLYSRGYEVLGIDNFERISPRAPRILKSLGIEMYKVDIRNREKLRDLMRDVDVVIHTAAYVDIEESFKKPLLYVDNNVVGTVSLLNICAKADVRRVIYLSSAAVYGEPTKLPINEDHVTKPLSPYGATKLVGEIFTEILSKSYGFEYVILRLFNVYGPGQEESPYAGVITKFISRMCRGEPPIIYGSGEQTRDFIHVTDVAKAIELSINTKYSNQIFNIATGKPTKIKDLARIISKLIGKEFSPLFKSRRPGDIEHSYADISKAIRLLGFYPKVQLIEGLKELIEIMCENRY